ncbi:MAG: hypothetical protein JG764_2064 [Clostridiales bacterium]|nr:hypothetical protein [Clostridiales bacterium]
MRFKKTIALVFCLIFVMAIAVGCSGKGNQQANNTENSDTANEQKETKDKWPQGGSIGTASVGGTYYVWGGAWSKLVNSKLPEFQVTSEETGGPVHNVQLIQNGDILFGLCSMPTAFDAWNGERWAKGQKYRDIRVLFPMYPSYAHFWSLAKSGIDSGKEITGHVINLGPAGGTPDTYYRVMFDILGIKPKKIVNSGFSDMVGQLKDGIIDVGANTGGAPHGSVLQTEATDKTNIFLFSQEEMEKIVEKLPCFFIGAIPKEAYESLDKDLPVLQYWNVLITSKDLPDDLAYELTKMYFENLESFSNVYKPTLKTLPKDVTKSVIPIHPGALKYYKEQGIEIPDNLIQ